MKEKVSGNDVSSRLTNPRARVYLPEILKYVSKLGTQEERVTALRNYAWKDTESLNNIKFLMECMYHPKIVLDLPEGAPPFKVDYVDFNYAPGTMGKVFKKIPYFVKGTESYITNQAKREKIFIQILETLYIDDAKLLIMIKDKAFDKRVYKNLDEDLFRAAFSNWLPPKEAVNG